MSNNTGYQDSADFTHTNNINGIETEHKTYNDSGSISWNVGEYTPTGDSEVGAQIYMPDHIDENTQIVVYYMGDQENYTVNSVSFNVFIAWNISAFFVKIVIVEACSFQKFYILYSLFFC